MRATTETQSNTQQSTPPKATSAVWSTLPEMAVHDIAKIFSMPRKEQMNDLREDIKANGIKVAVLVNKTKDTILDGLNRYRIAHELGFTPEQVPLEVFKGKEEDIPSEILSRNLFRRHLTEDQRVQLVDKILHPQLEAKAKARMTAGKPDPTVNSPEGIADPTVNSLERGAYADVLAKKAKVSQHKARQAVRVRKAGMADAVIAGKMRSKDAARKTKPKAVKSLKAQVWEKYSRLMKSFDKSLHREVRNILRGFLDGKRKT